ACRSDQCKRIVQVARSSIEIAALAAHFDAGRIAFDRQQRGPGHRRCQWLRSAHASESGGEYPAARQISAVVLASRFGEGLVRALNDALTADVDPRSGGHLPEHHQALEIG